MGNLNVNSKEQGKKVFYKDIKSSSFSTLGDHHFVIHGKIPF